MTPRDLCMEPVELAPARASEVASIGRLPGLSEATVRLLEDELADGRRCCLVASHDGMVVGYAAALRQLDDAHVTDVAVASAWRRRGVATRLVAELCRRMEADGAVAVTLEVGAGNGAAQALYRRLGFVVEGRRPTYYRDGEDALILWRRNRWSGLEED